MNKLLMEMLKQSKVALEYSKYLDLKEQAPLTRYKSMDV